MAPQAHESSSPPTIDLGPPPTLGSQGGGPTPPPPRSANDGGGGGGFLDWALTYTATRNLHVVALAQRSKDPRAGSQGWKDGTTDADLIRAWWTENENYNIGISLEKSGIMAFDIDDYHDDGAKLAALEARLGPLPPTLTDRSGSGKGRHPYYRVPPGASIRGMIDGIVLRWHHYCVAPPSIHPVTGLAYEWIDTRPIADLPPAWIEALKPSAPEGEPGMPDDEPAWLQSISQEQRIADMRAHLERENGERMGIDPAGTCWNVCRTSARGYAVRNWRAVLEAMLEIYNQKCNPPYDESEITRRVWNAYNDAHSPEWGHEYDPERFLDEDMQDHNEWLKTLITPSTSPNNGARDVWSVGQIKVALLKNERGSVRACGANIETILEHSIELSGWIRFNTIEKTVEIVDGMFARVPANDLPIAICNWIEREPEWAMFPSAVEVGNQLLYVARKHSYNPVAEYLDSLVWDGTPRIDTWLSEYCGAEKHDYTKRVGAMFLIGAVARGLVPGCKHDCVLTLIGPQGAKKSQAFGILGGNWYSDTPIKLGDKDGYMAASATWINELAELASVSEAVEQYEKHKAYLSSAKDSYRPPYGRVYEKASRTCVFGGTTNEDEYLADPTGNRRWWSVFVPRVNIAALKRDRDQLFAEAVDRFRPALASWPPDDTLAAGHRWWFTTEEQALADAANDDHTNNDSLTEKLTEWLAKQPMDGAWSTADIAWQLLTVDLAKQETRKLEKRVTDACRKCGGARQRPEPTACERREAAAQMAPQASSASSAELSLRRQERQEFRVQTQEPQETQPDHRD